MMTESMTGLYALTVFAAFIFFSILELADAQDSDEEDFVLVFFAALFWPVVVAVAALGFIVGLWKLWVSRG
ncbi:TPA: hypothetical protein ACPZDQ_001368 [Enterobacter roggenkampii]